jgi:hypothetical protein
LSSPPKLPSIDRAPAGNRLHLTGRRVLIREMKRVLTVLGVIFLALLMLGISGFIYIASRGAALDKESHKYLPNFSSAS